MAHGSSQPPLKREAAGLEPQRSVTTNTYGASTDGVPITEELIEKLSAEAEAGYDVEKLRPRMRRGRPAMGSAPADTVPVRLDPELRGAVAARAERDSTTQSEVIRQALRRYLA